MKTEMIKRKKQRNKMRGNKTERDRTADIEGESEGERKNKIPHCAYP